MAERLEALDTENVEAWQLFHAIACRLTMDFPGLAAVILERAIEDKSLQESTDLLDRMSIIYDRVHPPRPS